MIERQFVSQKLKEKQIQQYMAKTLSKAGYSHTEIKVTPLGEKVIIYTTRPGIVVGKKGENIKKLTAYLKSKFKMENPQIEVGEVQNPMLDGQYVADRIAYNLERFGAKRFKSIGYKVLQEVMSAGATGVELVISGKVPSSRAKSWRFSAGYLKKSGDIHYSKIKKVIVEANLKIGVIGIKLSIMTPDIELPDKMVIIDDKTVKLEEVKQESAVVEKKEEAIIEVKESAVQVVEKQEGQAEAKPTKKRVKKSEAEQKEKKPRKTKKEKEDGTDSKE